MKYTDGMFTVPVRIYDGYSVKKAIKREEDLEMPIDGEWAQGVVRLPFDEIRGFIDYFSKGKSVDEVEEDGFDCCIVLTKTLGEFVCNRSQQDIINDLNEFVEKYYSVIDAAVAKRVEEQNISVIVRERKRPWWRKSR